MTPKQRWLIIGSILLATLAAGYMIDDEALPENGMAKKSATTRSVASSSTPANRRSSDTASEAVAPLSFPESVTGDAVGEAQTIDPFRNKSWVVAPQPLPPAKSTAPPLPFQYLGKVIEDGGIRVFLNHQGQNLIVSAGDVINGLYTVVGIAGSQMTFLYQPLKEKQALSIGADN